MSNKINNNYHNFPKWEIISIILDYISNNNESTIPQISKKTGFSYTAVKNIIDELVTYQILKEKIDNANNKRGRPAQNYKIENPLELIYPNKRYDFLSDHLISSLIKTYNDEEINNFFNSVGRSMAKCTMNKWNEENIKIKKIDDLIFNLNNELKLQGIPNEINNHNEKMEIKIYNCIFEKLSIKFYPKICQIHKSYFSTLLNKTLNLSNKIEHTQSLSKRDPCCILNIKFDN